MHGAWGFCCRGLQRALKLSQPEQLVPYVNKHLKQEPYTLAELQSPAVFGVHPNTLFEGASPARERCFSAAG